MNSCAWPHLDNPDHISEVWLFHHPRRRAESGTQSVTSIIELELNISIFTSTRGFNLNAAIHISYISQKAFLFFIGQFAVAFRFLQFLHLFHLFAKTGFVIGLHCPWWRFRRLCSNRWWNRPAFLWTYWVLFNSFLITVEELFCALLVKLLLLVLCHHLFPFEFDRLFQLRHLLHFRPVAHRVQNLLVVSFWIEVQQLICCGHRYLFVG